MHGRTTNLRKGGNAAAGRSRAPVRGESRGQTRGDSRGDSRSDRPARTTPDAPPLAAAVGWREAIAGTVRGLGYELVDVERAPRGLLRVTIDRVPGHAYAQPGDAVTVDDCEAVTRQLQYALEVEGLDYARLEVSSPGLDRPLKTEADFRRFAGQPVRIALKVPFEGRKVWQGQLGEAAEGGWTLTFSPGKGAVDQVLGFALDELREANLVPVVDFKGRRVDAGSSSADEGAPEARHGHSKPGPASRAEEVEE